MAKSSITKENIDLVIYEDIPDLTELSEDIVESAINKEWKTYGKEGAEEVAKKCAKSKKKRKMTTSQLQNLRQFREKDESSPEAKQASLEQLRVPEEVLAERKEVVPFPDEVIEADFIRQVLTIDEQKYFVRRWNEYINEHNSDFNKAEDFDMIVQLIMNHIQIYRIEKKQKNSSALVFDKNADNAKHNAHIRIRNLMIDLKTRRKDRIESQENRQSKMLDVLVDLASKSSNDRRDEFNERIKQQLLSEEDMLRRKMGRKGIDAN